MSSVILVDWTVVVMPSGLAIVVVVVLIVVTLCAVICNGQKSEWTDCFVCHALMFTLADCSGQWGWRSSRRHSVRNLIWDKGGLNWKRDGCHRAVRC